MIQINNLYNLVIKILFRLFNGYLKIIYWSISIAYNIIQYWDLTVFVINFQLLNCMKNDRFIDCIESNPIFLPLILLVL